MWTKGGVETEFRAVAVTHKEADCGGAGREGVENCRSDDVCLLEEGGRRPSVGCIGLMSASW